MAPRRSCPVYAGECASAHAFHMRAIPLARCAVQYPPGTPLCALSAWSTHEHTHTDLNQNRLNKFWSIFPPPGTQKCHARQEPHTATSAAASTAAPPSCESIPCMHSVVVLLRCLPGHRHARRPRITEAEPAPRTNVRRLVHSFRRKPKRDLIANVLYVYDMLRYTARNSSTKL